MQFNLKLFLIATVLIGVSVGLWSKSKLNRKLELQQRNNYKSICAIVDETSIGEYTSAIRDNEEFAKLMKNGKPVLRFQHTRTFGRDTLTEQRYDLKYSFRETSISFVYDSPPTPSAQQEKSSTKSAGVEVSLAIRVEWSENPNHPHPVYVQFKDSPLNRLAAQFIKGKLRNELKGKVDVELHPASTISSSSLN